MGHLATAGAMHFTSAEMNVDTIVHQFPPTLEGLRDLPVPVNHLLGFCRVEHV